MQYGREWSYERIQPPLASGIRPDAVTLEISATQQLELVDELGQPVQAAWASELDAVARVDEDGFVTAVAPGAATITATAQGRSARARVEVVDNVGFAIEIRPVVVKASAPVPVEVLVDTLDGTTAVELQRPDGTVRPLERRGQTRRYALTLTVDQALESYRNDPSLQAFASSFLGNLHVTGPSASDHQVSVSVLGTNPEPVRIDGMGPLMQRSAHIVNIREGRLQASGGQDLVVKRFYESFGDDYDFMAISWAASDRGNIFYTHVRNAIAGLGLSEFDNSEVFSAGGTRRLKGIIRFLDDFDHAHQVLSHEIGHSCINHLSDTALRGSGAHWPFSTAAIGVMGVGGPNGPWRMTPLDSGDFRIDRGSTYADFNDLELYLLGLGPAGAVADQHVFPGQEPMFVEGTLIQGPGVVVTLGDIVSVYGERSPAFPNAQTEFSLATIVVTRGRLMTADEMAYFDARAARGEAQTPLSSDYLRPWYVSTRGRSTLSTTIR